MVELYGWWLILFEVFNFIRERPFAISRGGMPQAAPGFSKLSVATKLTPRTEQMANTVSSVDGHPSLVQCPHLRPLSSGLALPPSLIFRQSQHPQPVRVLRLLLLGPHSVVLCPAPRPSMSLQAGIDNTMRRPLWEAGYCRGRPPGSIGKPSVSSYFGPGSAASGLGHIILPNVTPLSGMLCTRH